MHGKPHRDVVIKEVKESYITSAKSHERPKPAVYSYMGITNNTAYDIIVLTRNGMMYKVKGCDHRGGAREIIFSEVIGVASGTLADPYGKFMTFESGRSKDDQLKSQLRGYHNREYKDVHEEFKVDHKHPLDALLVDEVCYFVDMDVVIALADKVDPETLSHPYSYTGGVNNILESETRLHVADAARISYYIVDRSGKFPPKYANFGGHIVKIPVISDKNLRDGVYVCVTNRMQSYTDTPTEVVTTYSYDDALKLLPIFSSMEEASVHGDPLKAGELKLKELTLQIKEYEQLVKKESAERQAKSDALAAAERALEHNRKMTELERKSAAEEAEILRAEAESVRKAHEAERKAAMEQTEHERRLWEMERKRALDEAEYLRKLREMERKEAADESSTARKAVLEVLKSVPAIVTAVMAIAGFIITSSKK